jgi:hypothetical protein
MCVAVSLGFGKFAVLESSERIHVGEKACPYATTDIHDEVPLMIDQSICTQSPS